VRADPVLTDPVLTDPVLTDPAPKGQHGTHDRAYRGRTCREPRLFALSHRED